MRRHEQKSIFKAYDIRGRYPKEINELIVAEIAEALARHFKKSRTWNGYRTTRGELCRTIVVGHDARLSSPLLYRAVLRGFERSNVLKNVRTKIISAGTMTTPMLYFLVNYFSAAGGIMVTASHNPKEYNGLKVIGKKAEPISGVDILNMLSR